MAKAVMYIMNKFEVLLFSALRQQVGQKTITVELEAESTVANFKDTLAEQYPGLKDNMGTMLVAINKEYAFDEEVIPVGAELAVFPPVSGGNDFPTIFSITEDKLDLDDILAKITLPSTGAACIFSGMVRGDTKRGQAHQTEHLEYQAYPEMAEAKMKQVADEIRQKYPAVEGIAIIQRIGKLMPGTPTVLIACSASHRDVGRF